MAKISGLVASLCVAMLLSACGGDDDNGGTGNTSTPSAACKSLTKVICEKFYTCFTKEQLAQAAELVGTSQTDCETKIMDCSEEETKCETGKTFSSSNASACLGDVKAYTCSELLNLADESDGPASCEQVCQ